MFKSIWAFKMTKYKNTLVLVTFYPLNIKDIDELISKNE